METMNGRIRTVRIALGLTQQEFADRLKLKSGNTFSMIERGKNPLTEQNIEMICTPNRMKEGYTVNAEWLRTGKGNMFITPSSTEGRPKLLVNGKEIPPEEEELVAIYRRLTPSNRVIAVKQIDVLLESQNGGEKEEENTGDITSKTG
jgi:transcriptional regulator with XRE-family HTH domain